MLPDAPGRRRTSARPGGGEGRGVRRRSRMSGMAGWLYILIPVALLILGFPIYLLLLITGLVALYFAQGVEPSVVPTTMFGSLDSFPLIAIPFFILAGEIMGRGGIAKRIIAWVLALVGGIRGTLAAVGRLLLPALREGGYGERFATSLISASGAIAVIIPPSIPLIIYGVVAQQAVTVLFLAGILPALLIGLIDATYVLTYARAKNVPITTG